MEKQQEQRSEQEELKDIMASREDGFGHRLKTARQEKGLTTLNIARELRLDEKIIVAIESEDHNRLPASAFVCGYIRNYARFMDIQPDPLIDYYKKEISNEGFDPELRITKGKEASKSVNIARLIIPASIVVVVMLVGLGGWMLWNSFSQQTGDAVTGVFSDEQESKAQSDSAVLQSNTDPDSLLLPVPSDTGYVPPEEISLQDASVNEKLTSEASEEQESESELASLADSAPEVESVTEPDNNADNSVESTIASEELVSQENASEEMAPDTDHRLILEFTGNSWIIIKDADNKKLSTGLKKSGDVLKLEGKKPYNIFLGDGRVVTVRINGQVFEHSQFINDKNVARFNVE